MSFWRTLGSKQKLTLVALLLIVFTNVSALTLDWLNKSQIKAAITIGPTEFEPLNRPYVKQISAFWLHIGAVEDRYKCINCAKFSKLDRSFHQDVAARGCTDNQKTYVYPWVLLENNGKSYQDYVQRFSSVKNQENYGVKEGVDSKIFAIDTSFSEEDLLRLIQKRQTLAANAQASWIVIRGSLNIYHHHCQATQDFLEKRTAESPHISIEFPALKKLHWPDQMDQFEKGAQLNLGRLDRFFLTPLPQ